MKGFVIFIITILFIIPILAYYTSDRVITVKINDKERVVESSDESKYLIFTDKGVFEDTDDLLLLKFNSSDVYNNLKKDSTYLIKVYGWRIPFLSMYPNIIEVKK